MRQLNSFIARRPATAVVVLSLLTPALTVLGRLAYIASPAPLGRVVVIIVVLLALVPLVITLQLITPARYAGHPKVGRIDLVLGPVSVANAMLIVAPTVLSAIAMQDPTNRSFGLGGAVVTALAAGATNHLSRSRWPSAWVPVQLSATGAPMVHESPAIGTAVRIRPGSASLVTLIVGLVAMGVGLLWAAVTNAAADLGFSLAAGALGIAFVVAAPLCRRIEAGCDESTVWFTSAVRRQSADRASLGSFRWSNRPMGGSLRLLSENGALALSVPTTLFRDDDVRRLISALHVQPAS